MALFFDAGRARPRLDGFASEGQRVISDFLAARVAAGELRPHDTMIAARAMVSTIAIGRLTGSPAAVDALSDLLFPTDS